MQYPEVVLTASNSREDIRRAIQASGKTQEEAAAAVGISPVTLSRWLNGHAEPSFDKLEALAVALGQQITLQFGDTAESPQPEWARAMEGRLRLELRLNRALIAGDVSLEEIARLRAAVHDPELSELPHDAEPPNGGQHPQGTGLGTPL